MKQLLCICIGLMMWTSLAQAQELTVVTEEWPPYNYTEDGEVVGIATEIVKATLAKAGVDYEILMLPWARAYKTAREEENVLIYSIRRSPEREELFKWACPLFPANDLWLFKLRERDELTVNTLEDVKAYKVGVVRDDIAHQFFLSEGFEKDAHLDIVSKDEQNIKKLFLERIDFIASPELVLATRMKALDFPFRNVEKVLLLSEGQGVSCMAFSPHTSDALVERVRNALEQVWEEGIVEAIIADYLESIQ